MEIVVKGRGILGRRGGYFVYDGCFFYGYRVRGFIVYGVCKFIVDIDSGRRRFFEFFGIGGRGYFVGVIFRGSRGGRSLAVSWLSFFFLVRIRLSYSGIGIFSVVGFLLFYREEDIVCRVGVSVRDLTSFVVTRRVRVVRL